jgi:two-component system, OmpR family, sensor histidine kinase VicK
LINRKVLEFAHPKFVEHWHELQEALWDRQIPTFSLDTCMIKKNGDSMWVRVSSILFEDHGATFGYTIVENINERKSIEQKLEQSYENQNLMVYMVAHDLRNPFHNILGLTNILKTITQQSPSMSRSLFYLSLIEKSCITGELLIDELILMGEIENQDIEVQNEDITAIIKDAIEAMITSVMEKQINLNQEYPEDKVILPVNREKLGRVITNLLSNAIKFSKSGGFVSITLKKNPEDILIAVTDSGIGIPLKLQNKVFERFTKSRRKGTNGENTTGLGLYISKRIIERHNGTIWFKSEEDKGSSFFIRIPAPKSTDHNV